MYSSKSPMLVSKRCICSVGKQYQHLWNGACAEGDDINKADNKHQLWTALDLKGENDEQNVEECAKQCKNRSGCLSFSIPYPNRYYDYMGVPAKCHLYNVQCKKFKDSRFWNSYQMGCGGDTCKKEWLDQSYVSVSLWLCPITKVFFISLHLHLLP